jgi:phosphohistidine phosphatase
MPLKRLILMRHGKAEQKSPTGGDFDRGLTERGRVDSRGAGAWLAQHGYAPELVLVSPAHRTVQTWEQMAPSFAAARVEQVRELYNAGADQILEQAALAGADSVMVVGHNPGMHAAAFGLVAKGMAEQGVIRLIREGFPTAAVVAFSFEDGQIRCEGLHTHRDAE